MYGNEYTSSPYQHCTQYVVKLDAALYLMFFVKSLTLLLLLLFISDMRH